DKNGANLFVNVNKAIEANCHKGVAKIRFIFKKVGKNDTTFMEEASHERHVDLPFMFGEASGTVIDGNVVCGFAMINLNGIQHNAPKGLGAGGAEVSPVVDILAHFHAPYIILSLPDDRDLHCSDYGWRNVLFCHLTVEFFLIRVSTQALIPLVGSNN
ncbi:hypothetical protein Tco_1451050, partial [Tanacetum coccineum]